MKKAICLFTFVLLLLSMFSCIPNEDVPGVENDEVNDTSVKCEHILTIPAPNNLCVKVQGATFDGEYYYVAFINNYLPYETAIIVKTDKNGNEVMRSAELPLDHANSITLLENGHLMVAHCQSPDGHYYRYSILDKDTFEIIETKDLNEPFMSIAYCKDKECFVSGEWNGDKMNVYNKNLELSYSFMVDFAEGSVPQSYYCNDNAIYAIRFINDGSFHNYLYIYSYSGETLLEYELDLPRLCEAEAVSVIGNDVFVICGDYDNCVVYKVSNLIKD